MFRTALLVATVAAALLAGRPGFGQSSIVLGPQQSMFAVGVEHAVGKRATFVCPPTDGAGAGIYGSDEYTADSAVCPAAVHAGVLKAGQAGVVALDLRAGAERFESSTRNGVTSRSYGRWDKSFIFVAVGEPAQITWRTTWNWNGRPVDVTQPLTFLCPGDGKTDSPVYGADVYAGSSAICVAAVHAGAISVDKGGVVSVRQVPPTEGLAGFERHGVSSRAGSTPADAFVIEMTAVSASERESLAVEPPQESEATPGYPTDIVAPGQLASAENSTFASAEVFQPDPTSDRLTGGAIPVVLETTSSPNVLSSDGTSGTPSAGGDTLGTAPPAAIPAPLTAPSSASSVTREQDETSQRMITSGEAGACTMPAPSVSVNATPGAVYLKWNALEDPAASAAPTYTVSRADLGLLTQDALRSTEFAHKTLLSYYTSATYAYTVVAQYVQGCGSSAVTVQPPRPWTPGLSIRECIPPPPFTSLRHCEETQFTPLATQYLVTAKRHLDLRLVWTVPRSVVPYGGDNTGWIVHGPGLGADGTYVKGWCGVIEIGCEPDRNPSPGGGLDFYVGPEHFPTNGEYTYTVVPLWDTPGGRFYDLSSAARVVVKIQ